MDNKNLKNDKSEEEPSTSSEVLVTGSSSSEKIDVRVEDVTRALNDEYKKLKANHLRVPCLWRGKSNKIAREEHSRGAKAYLDPSNYHRSLLLFTKSIAYAEDGSEQLARAYCRRACTLYKLDGFNQCVDDLDRALAAKCPSTLRVHALKMKARCLRFKEEARARGVKIEKRFLGEIFKSVVMAGEPSAASSGEADAMDEAEWRNTCQFDNPHIPNASFKIRLAYDETKWRPYLEATEDIKAGEIIASQKCFSLVIKDDLRYGSCSYCMELCQVLIPCQTCSEMMYCSIGCRDTAFESYHRLECKIVTNFLEREDLMHYPIRQLLIGTEQGAQLGNLIRSMSLRDLMTTKFPASQTFVDDYATVLRRRDLTFLDDSHQLKEYASAVAKMILILERAGFFDGDPSFLPDPEHPLLSEDTLTKAQIFTAFLLLNHLVGMNTDARGIGVEVAWDGQTKIHSLGFCYCPLYSAFNHFPSPNVEFLFRNRELVAFATRPIKKDEELLTIYCPSSEKATSLQQVKELRMKYGFFCQCSRCRTKWPDDDFKFSFDDLQFHDHLKLEPTILIVLKNFFAPSANSSRFTTLPTKEMLGIIVDVSEWFFTNAKAPSHCHAIMQCLVTKFISLMYDQFNSQLCSTERHYIVKFAHAFFCMLLADPRMANVLETDATGQENE